MASHQPRSRERLDQLKVMSAKPPAAMGVGRVPKASLCNIVTNGVKLIKNHRFGIIQAAA
jgi:hypothetical protein